MDLNNTGIYKITNIKNGKVYIGSASKSFNTRWQQHRNALKRGDHYNNHLQMSWNKYGEDSFIFEVLEICDAENCIERENYNISLYNFEILYNILPQAGSTLGAKRTKETKDKISKSHIGKRASIEAREKMRASKLGKKLSEDHKMKISKTLSGRKKSDEFKDKISRIKKGNKYNLGRKTSNETKDKISKANKNKTRNQEVCNKLSAASSKKKQVIALDILNGQKTFFCSQAECAKKLNASKTGIKYALRNGSIYKDRWLFFSTDPILVEYEVQQGTVAFQSQRILGTLQ